MTQQAQSKQQQSLYIIVPAHNEQNRIATTLEQYVDFFRRVASDVAMDYHIHVVLSGCTDNTRAVVMRYVQMYDVVSLSEITQPGKGRAVRHGFMYALSHGASMVGFVDADMATAPKAFWHLCTALVGYDGVIASRYMTGATIMPLRPWYKRWGSRLVYEPLVRMMLGISYHDYQCGAKLFRSEALATIVPYLMIDGWAFDIELLYLLHKRGALVKEVPTHWIDQEGSKLTLKGGWQMIRSVFAIASHHAQTKFD